METLTKGEALTIAGAIEREVAAACHRIGITIASALTDRVDHDMVVGAIEEFLSHGIQSMVEDAIESVVDTYDTQDQITDRVNEKVEELMPDTIEDQIESVIGMMVDQAGIPDQIRRAMTELTDRMNSLDQEIEEVRGVAAAAEAARSVVLPNGIRGRLRWLLTGR